MGEHDRRVEVLVGSQGTKQSLRVVPMKDVVDGKVGQESQDEANGTESFEANENDFEEVVRNVHGDSVFVDVVRNIRRNRLDVVDRRRNIIGERQHVETEG